MPRIVALLLAAAVSFAAQEVEHPPPGRLVDVGGRALHVHCTGSGTPTVVLEAGASSFAIDWALVQRVRLFCVGGPEGSRRGCERHGKSYLTRRRRGEEGDGGGSLTGGAIPSA